MMALDERRIDSPARTSMFERLEALFTSEGSGVSDETPARPLTIGLCGEFSSGKSSLANLLVASDMLPTSVVSNTRAVTRIRYAESLTIEAILDSGERQLVTQDVAKLMRREGVAAIEIGLPNPFLRHVELLDTPGFSDPFHDPEETIEAVKTFDIGIWCTLATQAWRYSEQLVWTSVPEHVRDNGILIATHRDTLPSTDDAAKVSHRLHHEAGHLFSHIIMISLPDAIQARTNDGNIVHPLAWRESGGEALLDALHQALQRVITTRHAETMAHETPIEDDALNDEAALDDAGKAASPENQAPFEHDAQADDRADGGELRQGETITILPREPAAPPPPLEPEARPEPKAKPAIEPQFEREAEPEPAIDPQPERSPTPEREIEPETAATTNDGDWLPAFVARAQEEIDGCRSLALVDLQDQRLLAFWAEGAASDAQPDDASRIIAFVADMLQSPKLRSMERFRQIDDDGEPAKVGEIEEFLLRTEAFTHLILRHRHLPRCVALFVVDIGTNMGLALVKSRRLMETITNLDEVDKNHAGPGARKG